MTSYAPLPGEFPTEEVASQRIANSIASQQEAQAVLNRSDYYNGAAQARLDAQSTIASERASQMQLLRSYPSLVSVYPNLASQLGLAGAFLGGVIGAAGAIAAAVPKNDNVQETYPGSGIFLPPPLPPPTVVSPEVPVQQSPILATYPFNLHYGKRRERRFKLS